MSSFPPRHICISGALAVAAGVGSIVGMIAGLIGGTFSFNLGFVGIPIGYGILIGRSSSRKWAIFFAAAGALFIAGFGGWAVFDHFTGGDTLPYPDGAYTAAELGITLVCCVYVLLILCRRSNREWFASISENPASSKSFAWAIAVTSAVLHISHHATEWWIEETHAQVFPFRVTVTPYNSQNGEGINSLSYDSDAISFSSNSKPDLPKVGVAFIGGRDGMQLEFSGVATRPVKVTLKSEGFEDTPITLDRNSDDEIRVAMLPIEATKPEQGVGGQPANPPRVGD
jgi:hypothetical protein